MLINDSLPLVSVITAVKNNVKTIRQTIESVLNQDYQRIKYIVIDGASTDGTCDIIKKYIDRIDVYKSEADSGVVDGINKGLRYIEGEYVFFLNGDDWIDTDYISKAVRLLASHREYYYVFGDLILYDKNDNLLRVEKGDVDFLIYLSYTMSVKYPSLIFRAICFEGEVFDKKYKVAPDYEFIMRLFKKKMTGFYSPDIYVNFRVGGNSAKYELKGYYEVLRASICSGSDIFISLYYYVFKVSYLLLSRYNLLDFVKKITFHKLKFKRKMGK